MSGTPPVEQDSDRWIELSELVSLRHDRALERTRQVEWLALALARGLTRYIQIPVGRKLFSDSPGIPPVTVMSYTAGFTPKHDEYKEVEHCIDAIGVDETNHYTFALNIRLEMGPRTVPTYGFMWAVRVYLGDGSFDCRIAMKPDEVIKVPRPTNLEGLAPLIERNYAGLVQYLRVQATGREDSNRIGFGSL